MQREGLDLAIFLYEHADLIKRGILVCCVMFAVLHVLYGCSLHTVAKRRFIKNAWVAWIPFGCVWTLGCLSDQYRYVTRGQERCRRHILLCLMMVLLLIGLVLCTALLKLLPVALAVGLQLHWKVFLLVLLAVFLVVMIVLAVFYRSAAGDLLTSMDPTHTNKFLVWCTLTWVPEPVYLFRNRQKDLGMPPRCDMASAPATAMK